MLTPNDEIVRNADPKMLSQAKADDERHRLHAEQATSIGAASPYFHRWVTQFLEPVITSNSKREQVMKQFIWPPVTVDVVDEIMDMTGAVHQAEDRFMKVDLTDAALESDCYAYLDRISFRPFITRNCHNRLYSGPNSFVVIDLPALQLTDFPEPYFYLVESSQVLAAKAFEGATEGGLMEFVWFKTSDPNVTALFDTVDYCLFERAEGTGNWVERAGSKRPHNLPFCPVFKLWPDVEERNPLASNTVLRPQLGVLDRMMFWDAGCESNDLATAFMMFWHLNTANPSTADTTNVSQFLGDEGCRPTGVTSDGFPYAPLNPVNPVHRPTGTIYGPGTRIPVPAPRDKDDADLRPPAGYLAPEVDNLEYVKKKVVELRAQIKQSATGYEAPVNDQAVNEKQVLSIIERSKNVYKYLAEHFEVLEARLLTALCSLRYGPYFIEAKSSYGRRFTLLTGAELATLYESSKKAGLGFWLLEELSSLQKEYYARGDSSRKLRFQILDDLNPYYMMSVSEMQSAGVPTNDPDGYLIAVNLPRFVRRFERENDLSIEQFCKAPDYNNRIISILDQFKRYGTEQHPIEPEPDEQPIGGGSGKQKPGGRSKPTGGK